MAVATTSFREAYLPLYVGDFLAATAEWTGEEQGLYLLLLGYQWSIGSLPTDPDKLCRMIRWDARLFAKCWPQVSEKFPKSGDRLQNPRLEQHREKVHEIANKRSQAGKAGAKERWQTDGNCHADANGNGIASATDLPMASGMPSKPNQTKPNNPEEPKAEAKRPKKPARVGEFPEGFTLTPELSGYIATQIPDADAAGLFAQFEDQAKAKAWEYADWSRAFQTYVRHCKPGSGHFAEGQYPRRGQGGTRWQ